MYCTTLIPGSVGYYIAITVKSRSSKESEFNRITELLTAINIMSNFYIYCLTIPSFRALIRTTAIGITRRFANHSDGVDESGTENGVSYALGGLHKEETAKLDRVYVLKNNENQLAESDT
jgi:hypothetical protein